MFGRHPLDNDEFWPVESLDSQRKVISDVDLSYQ